MGCNGVRVEYELGEWIFPCGENICQEYYAYDLEVDEEHSGKNWFNLLHCTYDSEIHSKQLHQRKQ